MKRFLRSACVLAATAALTLTAGVTAAHADTTGGATVTASALNMRSEASTSGSIVTCLPRGMSVIVTGDHGDWYQVAYRGQTGYMSADYLSFSSSLEAAFGNGSVTGNQVRVRSGAGTDSSVLGYADKGDIFAINGVSGNWCMIDYNGQTGYISGSYICFTDAVGGSSSSGTSSSSSVSGPAYINATDVRLRSGPGTSYSILGTYSTGTNMTVTGLEGSWYKVEYSGRTGYVYKTYLTIGSAAGSNTGGSVTAMTDTDAYVISPVHMRSGPSSSYTSQRVLGTGTAVTITGSTEKWYRVTYNGAEGYIFKTYLTTDTPSGSTSNSSSSEGQRLVDEAKKYLGVGYVYGGTSPSGFDCSGFVYYVYRQCGYSITRTATAQNSVGTYVSRGDLQPGDIIIFYNSAKSAIGHAGIYIGNGQFIHASSGSGKVVITNLSASYYNTHYYSARRVVS